MTIRVNKNDSPWKQFNHYFPDLHKYGFIEVDTSTNTFTSETLTLVPNEKYELEKCIASYFKLIAEMQHDLKIDILYSNIVLRTTDCSSEPVTVNAVDEALDTLHDIGLIQLIRDKRVAYIASIDAVNKFIKGDN